MLEAPREIRDSIYEQAVLELNHIKIRWIDVEDDHTAEEDHKNLGSYYLHHPEAYFQDCRWLRTVHALALVNKQINEEVMEVFLTTNKFALNIDVSRLTAWYASRGPSRNYKLPIATINTMRYLDIKLHLTRCINPDHTTTVEIRKNKQWSLTFKWMAEGPYSRDVADPAKLADFEATLTRILPVTLDTAIRMDGTGCGVTRDFLKELKAVVKQTQCQIRL